MTTPPHLPWAKKYPPSVDWSAPLDARPLYEILDDSARQWPDNPAFDFMGKTTTYKTLAKLVARAAKGLQNLGIKKGDRIGMFLPNTPAYPIMYYAALKIGAVVVNFNPLYAEREVERQIKDSGAIAMVTIDTPAIFDKLPPMFEKTGLKHIIVAPIADMLPLRLALLYPFVKRAEIAKIPPDPRIVKIGKLLNNNGDFSPAAIDPQRDLAVLQYTGGTTGIPKGAMLTHANLHANARQSLLSFPCIVLGEERMLAVIPFFHVFGMTAVLNITLLIGGKLIMLPQFALGQTVRAIDRERPTIFPAVPTIFTAINHYRDLAKFNLRSLKFCVSGGAPLPAEVKRDFEKLTGCILVEGYGLSETSAVTHCNPMEGENKTGSIGLPVPGTFVEIVSLEDRKTLVPQGERGELCVRGPQVMAAYWNQPQETADVLEQTPDGLRLHTGDVAYLDPDGYTFIVDRIKDMIAASGFKIYPRLVEEALYQHPSIEECAVAGVPDKYRGQTVKAWIKLREGQSLTADELRLFLKDRLSAIEIPKSFEFKTEPLPKTLVGKISRKLLVEGEEKKTV
ncbi:MAG: long-chain fatty acid--CoA ligase [Bdellovibrionales bacterium]